MTRDDTKHGKRYLLENLFVFLGIFFFLALSHRAALLGYYVLHDDLFFWEKPPHSFAQHPLHDISAAMGRAGGAYILTLAGWMVNVVSDLNLLRVFSLAQLSASALLCFICLKKQFPYKFVALLISAVIFTLPPFQVMVFWTGACFHSTAVLLASLAGFLICRLPLNRPVKRNFTAKYFILAAVLLFCAISTYASAATFYWALCALVIYSLRKEGYVFLKRTAFHFFAAGAIAHIAYAILLQIMKQGSIALVRGMHNPYRVNTDYFAKLEWFFSEPLVNTLNFWNIFPSKIIAFAVLLFMAVPIIFVIGDGEKKFQRSSPKRNAVRRELFTVFVFIALVPLSYLPNLVSVGESPYYRCLAGLMPLFLVMFLWALTIYFEMLPQKVFKRSLTAILIISCLYASYQANATVYIHRAAPSQRELTFLIKRLQQADMDKVEEIAVISKKDQSQKIRYDEYGVLTHPISRCIRLMVKCALREIGKEDALTGKTVRIVDTDAIKEARESSKIFLIDFNEKW